MQSDRKYVKVKKVPEQAGRTNPATANLKRISYPDVVDHRLSEIGIRSVFLRCGEWAEEFCLIQNKTISRLASGIIYFDTDVETKHKKSEIKPQAETRADAQLLVK